MNREIFRLDPIAVWEHFYALTQIPRPSKNEEKVITYLKNFGEKAGLETIVDKIGNVIIKKPATTGMEHKKGVILQTHIDMVPQKNNDKIHDFVNDPIEAYIDNEWVKANGTTLGADNGIGVAAAMGILQSTNIKHGYIEALFTTDEETGMTGATHLSKDILQADILLNLDSEDEGELCIGCAGGINTNILLKYNKCSVPKGYIGLKISVTGLKGGHSGVDIILNRGNANKILNKLLQQSVVDANAVIAHIDGGSLRNAIPREAFASIAIPAGAKENFYNIVAETEAFFMEKLINIDSGLQITLSTIPCPEYHIETDTSIRLLEAIDRCPNGVVDMMTGMDNVVETSSNLAIVKTTDEAIMVSSLQRSSIEAGKLKICNEIRAIFEKAGASVVHEGDYPGWQPKPDSPILQTMKTLYKQYHKKDAEIKVIHAGLECGLLGKSYPDLDMISFGPTICFPHSPDEKVNIASVKSFWDFLILTLENIPDKEA